MEALELSDPVLPIAASVHQSRPGPVVGCGERVFQSSLLESDEQMCRGSGMRTDPRDQLLVRSMTPKHGSPVSADETGIHDRHNVKGPYLTLPGRTSQSSMEDPVPPDTVQIFEAVSHHSRPGPVIGLGGGVFQTAFSVKYTCSSEGSSPDGSPFSSTVATGLSQLSLRIYYQNVRGLRTKIDAFFLAATESDFDIIVLTETWLDDRIFSPQLFGNSFTVFRTDRSRLNSRKTRGGGVLIAVATRLNCCIDPATICTSLEQLWVKIHIRDRSISVGVLYLPPDRKNDLSCIQNHIDSIGAITSGLHLNDLALQFGDYNQSGLVWSVANDGLRVNSLQSHMSSASCALLDGFCFHGLTQINNVVNRNARLLDLVLTNNANQCTVTESADPLIGIDADHPAIEVMLQLPVSMVFEQPPDLIGLDFRRADYNMLTNLISRVDWQFLDLAPCIDDAVELFCSTIHHAINESVPQKRPPQKPPWSNPHLRMLKRLRNAALRRYCNNRSQHTKQLFARASSMYRKQSRFLYNRHVRRMQSNLRRNPKLFWKFVNSKRNEDGLPSTMMLGDSSAITIDEKCNLFADHFKKVFNDISASPSEVEEAIRDTPRNAFSFNAFRITEDLVTAAIRRLKHSLNPGPDGIPSSVIKGCSGVLIAPLTKIFNMSLQQCKFPSQWKFSQMFPVYKKGDKRNVANYRGITSLCSSSKVLEIIINDALFSSCKNYISDDQHGFYPKRSVSSNLVQFVSLCRRAMDSGAQVDAIYTDFKAAFDRVDHKILLGRLEKLGVSISLVAWFKSYLTDRAVCVSLGSSQSDTFPSSSGVPQGSNLGPLLFSLFINEIALLLPPGCRVFYADDVKIFKIITCLGDCQQLQSLLDCFHEWSSRNMLTLCVEKCSVITFHRKLKPIKCDYTISGSALERVDQIRDLGVRLDRELSFKCHYNDLIARANRQLGFVFKVANEFRDPHCLLSLYNSLVRSILEHSSVVWCPYQRTWIARIESVQRKFVRYALRRLPWNNPQHLPPYEDRCQLLRIETLEKRRSIAQVMFTAKVLTGRIDSPALLSELNLYAPERNLRQRNFLYLEPRNSDYGIHDPIRFMAGRFNAVYHHFDFNISMETFRRRLSRIE